MIGKGKAIAHGGNAINYALREGKMDRIVGRNMLESDHSVDILQEFEMVNQHNYRCKNKYIRFEIGIAPQDKDKLMHKDMPILLPGEWGWTTTSGLPAPIRILSIRISI